MNKKEKNALISFLSIYIISSTIFMAIIAVMYFEREKSMLEAHCSMRTSQAAWRVKSEILEMHMDKKPYVFKERKDDLHYAVLNKDGSIFFSTLLYPLDVDLRKQAHHQENRSLHVLKLADNTLPFGYIVIEDTSGVNDILHLKYFVLFLFVMGFVIMSVIGYILSRILLKPVKEKAEQLNRFVKDSSHELNTPITAMMMIIPRLKKLYFVDEKTINQLTASAKNVKHTYDKLLFNINSDVLKKYDEVFDLKLLIEENILFFDEIAKSKSITLHANLSSCEVFMDRQSANMIVNNLLSNAIKYTRKRKNIFIELQGCTLSVKDEGIGIEPSKKETIFKRYNRATNEEGGFGLGLDIVASVCREYGIKIDLETQLNQGSEFKLDFSEAKNVLYKQSEE
ncbi:sensor histidine kinase [Candidatus Marinarcus aquaticus]|uniref:histidine kinase n=1 Tax=Candidatus Marinarcus aquaticus TaxID=2044504 RepID=A0A4Q0XUA4_9BACT|nr:HAMP domain-containing sensor histidine kinase [Candidatus Marinarcus aquaticus]RXJ58001.1 hypothetical protein CRV04_05710 [Candidatus Marinarcus aquaticus]